jgi:hypothetical protein
VVNREMLAEAQVRVVEVTWQCSVFLAGLARSSCRERASLHLLQIPGTTGGAERAAAGVCELQASGKGLGNGPQKGLLLSPSPVPLGEIRCVGVSPIFYR